MNTVASDLTALVKSAADAAGFGDSPVPLEPALPTADARFGDYQSNYAFRVGKALRTNPRAVAVAMVEHLPASEMVASVDVAGPGFINFKLNDSWIGDNVRERAGDDRFGTHTPGAGKTLVLDYSSPNIAKRMHVGHLRSTIIGNALHRIYAFLGWRVVADNHVGDWGTQFGKLIVGWQSWRDDAAFEVDPIGELQRIYQKFGDEAEGRPELMDQARAETAKLQEGDSENRALWEQFVDVSMREFDAVYERLGVQFDVTLGESFYRDQLAALMADLESTGVAVRSDGALIIEFSPEDGKGLAKSPLLVQKSDGAALYGTTDLATVQHRMDTWNPDLIGYVTDVRQQLHFRQVFATCKKMGLNANFYHAWFGMLRFADGAVASTRSGQALNLVDVLDTAAQRALEVVNAKSGHLPEAERLAIAEIVGAGAIKYTDLSQNPQSDIVFEWDKMLSLEGNTAPYLMYAHARCHSIFRKAGISADFDPGPVVIGHERERELAVALLRTPEIIDSAAAHWRPNMLADHLYQVASAFARFWSACRVLDEGIDPEVMTSRLALCRATAGVLSQGLGMLGIKAPTRM